MSRRNTFKHIIYITLDINCAQFTQIGNSQFASRSLRTIENFHFESSTVRTDHQSLLTMQPKRRDSVEISFLPKMQRYFYVFTILVILCKCQSETHTQTGLAPSDCYGHACPYDYYCSDAPTFAGCRPCTNVVDWCLKDLQYLRRQWPSCDNTCQREIARQQRQFLRNRTDQLLAEVAETNRKLNVTDTKMTKLSEKTEALQQQNNLLKGQFTVLEIIGIIFICLVTGPTLIMTLRTRFKNKGNSQCAHTCCAHQPGCFTAYCLGRKCTEQQPAQTDAEAGTPLMEPPRRPIAVEDRSNCSDPCLTVGAGATPSTRSDDGRVAPNGHRTEHNVNDDQDFQRSSITT